MGTKGGLEKQQDEKAKDIVIINFNTSGVTHTQISNTNYQ